MQTIFFKRFLLAKTFGDEMIALDDLAPETCLSANELLRDAAMRLPTSRRQFRAGRVLFKTAIFASKKARADETIALVDALERDDYAALDVESRDEFGRGVAPALRGDCLRGSIAHVSTAAVAVYPLDRGATFGCDVVEFGSVKRNMLDLFFTKRERERFEEPDVWEAGEQDVAWGMKEAAYKAVGGEAPFTPNQTEVVSVSDGRGRVRVGKIELQAFVVERDRNFATIVASR